MVERPRKRNWLLEATALVEWDGRMWSCIGKSYDERPFSQKIAIRSKAKFIIKVVQVMKALRDGKEVE